MNIVITNYMETTYPGGINKVIVEIAEGLSKKGHDITIIQPNLFDLSEEEICKNFRIIRIKSRMGNFYGINLKAYSYLKTYLEEHEVDLIHIHGYQTFFSLLMIKAIKKVDKNIPIVFSPHMDIFRSTFAGKHFWNVYNFFAKSIFSDCDYIISPSNFEAAIINEDYNTSNKISIISHGVKEISNKGKVCNKQDSLNLLYSGYLVERKGVNFILDSLNYLVYELNYRDVKLTIIGEGPEKTKLLKQSKKLKLDNYVKWKSFLSRDKFEYEINKSNIFLLLSHSEAYGISVAEALASGIPTIVTNNTALKEFINENGCFGVNYPPNPKEVAELIIEIYRNNVEVGPFSNKIRTWNEVVADYERIYEIVESNKNE